MQNDTIAAIATPPGVGGIGVIRVSGPEAFARVLPLLQRPSRTLEGLPEYIGFTLPPSHKLTYGHVVDPNTSEMLDEVLVAFMRAPHTYTREDVVEISGHGGPLVLQRILRLILAQGIRMANPGEFTLRAFLNGRLDLAQAEAVMDLISAQTEAGQRLAMQQLRGRISEQIQEARRTVLGVVARIEASIDFPEEDVPVPQPAELQPLIEIAIQQVDALLASSEQGRLYRQGLRTAIIGRPNVGKSSLLNALLRSERAIVTPIAGTTRDTVEEVANLRGIPLHLIDTAGITPSDDPVEQIGVQRSRVAAETSDVILLVFDGAEPLTEQDRQVSQEVQAMDRPVILVVNKADRPQRLEIDQLRNMWPDVGGKRVEMCSAEVVGAREAETPTVGERRADQSAVGGIGAMNRPLLVTSTLTGSGLSALEEILADLVLSGKTIQGESILVTSTRHQEALRRAAEHLRASLIPLHQGLPMDFVSIDLRAAYDALGEVTGETASEDLLERIFSEFCIGK